MNHNESINLPQQKQWTKQYCPSVTWFSDDRLLTFFYSWSCSADDFTAAWGSFIPQCHIINKILILVFSLDICKRHGQNKTIKCVKILSCVYFTYWTPELQLCHCSTWHVEQMSRLKCHFRGLLVILGLLIMSIINSVWEEDLKPPHSTTSDRSNVILINQTLFELLFTLCCPPVGRRDST